MDMDLVALRRQWRHQEASAALAAEEYRRAVLKADRDGDPAAALAEAAEYGDADAVRLLLLNCSAWVNCPGRDDRTALHVAVSAGGRAGGEVIRLLLAAGASVKAKDVYSRTPLHVAARAADVEAIPLLLAAGADIHAKTNDGETPLDLAFDPDCRELLAKVALG